MGIRTPVNASHDKGPVPTQAASIGLGIPWPSRLQQAYRLHHLQLGDRLTAYALFFVRFVLLCAGILTVTTVELESSILRDFSLSASVPAPPPIQSNPCQVDTRHSGTATNTKPTTHPLELDKQPPDPTTEELTTPTLATPTKPDNTLHSGKKTATSPHQTMR